MTSFAERFKLGKHYRMERFALLFGVFSALFVLVLVGCFISQVEHDTRTLTDDAIYSTEFTSSRTGITGTVEGVFVSQDKTKSFVLGKFSDIKAISTNADNYQMFLTAVDSNLSPQTLNAIPAGSFYVFGSTGYFGAYLVNSEGFEPQILDLVVRCNAEYVQAGSQISASTETDGSFATYDQFRMYFNPGGAKATVAACLSGDKAPAPVDIYAECVVAPQELELREKIADDEAEMQRTLAKIEDLTDEARRAGLVVDTIPDLVKGDSFTKKDSGDGYVYECETVTPGGFYFDWESGNVTQGYLKDLLSGNDTVTTLLAKKTQEGRGNQKSIKSEWRTTEGILVEDLNTGDTSGPYATYSATISNLENAWSSYISLKNTLQTSDLRELIVLESSLSNIDQTTTINIDDNVLLCY